MTSRRRFLTTLAAVPVLALPASVKAAWSQEYPEHPLVYGQGLIGKPPVDAGVKETRYWQDGIRRYRYFYLRKDGMAFDLTPYGNLVQSWMM